MALQPGDQFIIGKQSDNKTYKTTFENLQQDIGLNVSDSQPTNPIDGSLWVDTSADPPVVYVWDATNGNWEVAGGGSLPDLNSGEFFLGDAANTTQKVTMSGDATLDNTGKLEIINNVDLGGSPTTTTQAAGTNNKTIATTEFVTDAVAAGGGISNIAGGDGIDLSAPDALTGTITISADLKSPGNGLVIDGGELDVQLASETQTGVVKVGDGIGVDGSGEITADVKSVSGGSGISVTDTNGDVEVDVDLAATGTGLYFNSDQLDIKKASKTEFGVVQVGAGINVVDGVISVDLGGLNFVTTVDLTSNAPKPSPVARGDAYQNTGDGVYDSVWDGTINLTPGDTVENGDFVVFNGTDWVYIPQPDPTGTNLNYVANGDNNATLESSTGTDATIPVAISGSATGGPVAGLFTGTEKEKLEGIEAGATKVENTSDLNNDGENGDPFITNADLPTKTSELTNDGEDGVNPFITAADVNVPEELNDLDDVNVPSPTGGDVLSYDGTKWVSAAAPPADISGSSINQLNDVDASTATDGQILVWDSSANNWVPADRTSKTSELTNDGEDGTNPFITAADLPTKTSELTNDGENGDPFITGADVGDGKLTIKDADGNVLGEFTANQETATEIVLPDIPDPVDQIHIGDTYPGTPSVGDLWVDTSQCPPVLLIYNDCDGTDGWKPIGGAEDTIDFTPLITDDGTSEGNTPGHILTAAAVGIDGGTAPVEYAYDWIVDGLTMGNQKTLNIVNSFVGKIVSCVITVAEPDGSDGVDRTAIYPRVIEISGTVNKPTVLSPQDGAGSGDVRYLKSDTIIAVEGNGSDTYETDGIDNVDDTNPTNIVLSFPTNKDFDGFEIGEVVQEPDVKIISKDAGATPPTITVDGGKWDAAADIIGDIVPTTDNGFFYDDPDIDPSSADPQLVFNPEYNTGIVLIARIGAFIEVNFLTPRTVTSSIELFGGNYTSGSDNFRIYVNDIEVRRPGGSDGRWVTRNHYDSAVSVPFSGQLNSIKLVSDWPEAGLNIDGIGIREIFIDGIDLADKVTGTVVQTEPGQSKLSKTTTYDNKLTLASNKDLDVLEVGNVVKMGMDADVPYQPVSDSIVTVTPDSPSAGQTTLTLSGDTDLAYFRKGDVVQSDQRDTLIDLPFDTANQFANLGINTSQLTAVGSPVIQDVTGAPDGITSAAAFNGSSYLQFPSQISPVTGGYELEFYTMVTAGPDFMFIVFTRNSGDDILVEDNTRGNYHVCDGGGVHPSGYKHHFGGVYGQVNTWYKVNIRIYEDRTIKLFVNGVEKASDTALSDVVGISRIGVASSDSRKHIGYIARFKMYDIIEKPEVKIISIDDSVPSITVDGGEWYADPANGGDGSGDATGDTEVTCASPLKAPTNWTIEAIEGNTLSLSHATPDDNAQVWVANDNQAGTDFFVTGPNFVDEPLLTADVELESTPFNTTPSFADTLSKIVWELNGVEYDAGTQNPFKPSLSTNTNYTVRVKHIGTAFGESEYSDSVTFTTGATRNLYTYYKERVELLEARLAGIESNEVVDDATDAVLLTAVADLVSRVETLEGN